MSFMEYPQPDACRALMPSPVNPPPGPPSRPMVCHMPAGHEGPHAPVRRPGRLDRRWDGDARPAPATSPTVPVSGPEDSCCSVCREIGGPHGVPPVPPLAARSGGAQDDGLRARIEALAEELEEASRLPVNGEFDRGVAAHQRDLADRLRRALAGPDDTQQDGAR